MKPPAFRYARAQDSHEAVALLSEHGSEAKVLAGGQSLVPMLSFRLAQPAVLIDLNQASGLDYVRQDDGHVVIGAMTRQRSLETDPMLREAVPLLAEALRHVGHVTNRNRGTIGGSIAHADPAAELPTLVKGLGGELTIEGPAGSRTVAAGEFFLGSFVTAMDYDEIVTAVRLPSLPSGTGVAVEELARRHGDFALVAAMAAVHLDAGGRADLVRLALSGVDSVPVRVHESEAVLAGSQPTDELIDAAGRAVAGAINPLDDIHAPAAYRRDMAQLMLTRAIRQAADRARGVSA
jgi:aerobic carbon-monoxide dehydrogenase medium subunit